MNAIFRLGDRSTRDCRACRTGRRISTRSGSGCRGSHPACRCRCPSRSRRAAPATDTPSPGRSTAGSTARRMRMASSTTSASAAEDLARFVAELRAMDPTGAPRAGAAAARARRRHARGDRGGRGVIDADAALAAWERALEAPAWDGTPVWIHTDLLRPNLLVHGGRLCAVIDFGGVGRRRPRRRRDRRLERLRRRGPPGSAPRSRSTTAPGSAPAATPCTRPP